MMKENILVLTNNIAGLHSFRREVMKAIIDEGYELYISEPDDDERVKYFEAIGCHIIKTKFNRRGKNPWADLALMLRYFILIKKIRPRAVLTYTIKPNVYGGMACRLAGAPQLANVTGLGDAIENGGWLQKLTVSLYRIGIGKAACVFFQNQTNKNTFLKSHVVMGHSVLLPGSGVNLKHHVFQTLPSDGLIRFLYIGRLLKDKGIEELFDTAKIIREKYPMTEFQFLGSCEGNFKNQLEEMVKDGIIVYLGKTTDVRTYLKNVHCTIMPSYHEGMSNVNLESAANGRPVITSDVPGCRETVNDGMTGYLVPARNSQALADAVERYIMLPYKKKEEMGRNARRKVELEFDRNIVIKAYLDEIKNLCV